MRNNLPIITIIIATYNSERTLGRTLFSIRKQTIQQKKLEILVVDGGSKDKTLSLAKAYRCRIIKNPMVEPVHAKYLGFFKARGKYIIGLDAVIYALKGALFLAVIRINLCKTYYRIMGDVF